MLRWLILVALVFFGTLPAATAVADALDDFERAEQAYRDQRYAVAAGILEGLLAAIDPQSADPAIVMESRKYLGASYLFLGRDQDADRQFRLLLAQDATFRIDPAVFPSEVVDRFETVRRRLDEELAQRREGELERALARVAEQEARLAEERARYAELYELAATSPVMRRNSRLLAVVPFGVGQFQNERRILGRFFAIAEGVSLGAYVTAYAWYAALGRRQVADSDLSRWYSARQATRWTNWISGAAFLTLTISGAVEAQVNFVPLRVGSRPREVPERFRPVGDTPAVTTQISLTPTGMSLRVDF